MMPPADRIYDPGQGVKKDLTDTGDDFLAIGPALQIMHFLSTVVDCTNSCVSDCLKC